MFMHQIKKFARYHFGKVGWIAMDNNKKVYWWKYKPKYDHHFKEWLDNKGSEDRNFKLLTNQCNSGIEPKNSLIKL